MAETKYVSRENLSRILTKIKETYVVKVDGKGLSTNDFTNDLLAKLNGVAEGAQVNVIESVKVNGVAQAITEKSVNVTVPTKTSDITNDSGFITSSDIPEGAAASTTSPLMDGAAAVGTEMAFARGDHRHPTDTSRAAAADLEAEITRAKAAEETNATAAANAKSAADAAQADVDVVKGDYLKNADKEELQGNINTVSGKVDTLVGTDANKSVRTIANEELAKQLIPDNAAESLNELTEIAAWIQSHPGDASAMNAAIVALQNQLNGIDAGEGTVKKYVDDAITALKIGDYAKAADLTALAGRVTTLEGASHTHTNKEELDKIVSGDKAKWDAVAADYVKASELKAFTDSEIDEIWNAAIA